jgi:hypothetical protein
MQPTGVAGATAANSLMTTVVRLRVGTGSAQSILLGASQNPVLVVVAVSLLTCLVLAMTPAPRTAETPPPDQSLTPA